MISSGEVRFVDNEGAVVLSYAKLQAWDAVGKNLPARFVASNGGIGLSIDEHGACYPITVDPIAQQAYLAKLPILGPVISVVPPSQFLVTR